MYLTLLSQVVDFSSFSIYYQFPEIVICDHVGCSFAKVTWSKPAASESLMVAMFKAVKAYCVLSAPQFDGLSIWTHNFKS